MARSVKNKKLDTRTARRGIPLGKATHWITISRGRALGYRRGRKGGTWIARFDAEHFRQEQKLGDADDILDADGVQILDYAQALQKANQFFLSALTRATGEAPRRGAYTVKDSIADYLKHLEGRGTRDCRNAKYDFEAHVIPKLGGIPVNKLSGPRLEEWRAEIANSPKRSQKKQKDGEKADEPKPMTDDERRRRRSTTNRILRRLKAALNYALETGKVNANPMNWRIRSFANAETARANFLSERQQQAFVKACAAEKHFQDLVLAALHSGCRYSELARLRVRDFIPSGPSIFVETSKAGKSRHVFLDKDAEDFFRSLASKRPPDDLLLPRSDGEAWGKDDVKKPMRRALKAAEMSGIQFHSLRHSFATRLLTRGITMQLVAKMLGHSSVRMIDRNYGHLTDDHMKEMIASVPSAGLNRAAKSADTKVVQMRGRRGA